MLVDASAQAGEPVAQVNFGHGGMVD